MSGTNPAPGDGEAEHGAGWTLPAEVAEARRTLGALARRLAGGAEEHRHPLPGSPRPVAVLGGAPGRGRHAVAAALLGEPPADTGAPPRRWVHTDHAGRGADAVGEAAVAAPLLEEFDLHLPTRDADGRCPPGAASAVLLLVDAAAPLDRDELAALVELAGSVEVVVPVLVRIDAHRGWRTVLDADRALVAEALPRLGGRPWFPVSVELSRRADLPGVDPVAAAALRRASGLAPLQRALHDLLARRRRMLTETNALRRLATDLAAFADRAEGAVPRAAAPVGNDRRRRHVHWRAGLAAARIAALDDVGGRVRALASDTRRRVDRAPRAELAALPARLAAELEVLTADVVAALGAELRRLVAATLADLLDPGELAGLRIPAPRPPPATPAPGPRAAAPEDRLLVVAGASGGLGLSRLALLPLLAAPVLPTVLGVAVVPVSVGLGVGAGAWLVHARRAAADRAHLRQWAHEALTAARADLDRVLAEALVATEREVTLALDAALDRVPGRPARRGPTDDTDDTDTAAAARAGAARAEVLLARVREVLAT